VLGEDQDVAPLPRGDRFSVIEAHEHERPILAADVSASLPAAPSR
jgi:hypothetical protein